jgi:hypothetical protein
MHEVWAAYARNAIALAGELLNSGSLRLGTGKVNGVADRADFGAFAGYLVGPDVGIFSGCNNADLDLDMDVDLPDFAMFRLNFGTGL